MSGMAPIVVTIVAFAVLCLITYFLSPDLYPQNPIIFPDHAVIRP